MTLARLLNQPLTLVKNNTSTKDEYGNTIQADGTSSSVTGFLEQLQSIETLNDRDTVVTGWQAYFPAGTDVNAFDRIVYQGHTYQVDGDPWLVYNPRVGSVSHIQAKLKVVI